jgi:hypothetical protein
MTMFFKDTFAGGSGTHLTAHVPELGGWDPTFNYYDPTFLLLDGAGRLYSTDPSNAGSPLTSTVAPSLDFYVQMTVNIAAIAGRQYEIDTYEHNGGPDGYSPFNVTGFQFQFFDSRTTIYHPSYVLSHGAAPDSIDIAAVAGNVDLRVEYSYSTDVFKVYVNSVLVWTLQAPDYTLSYPPSAPGTFGFIMEAFAGALSGLKIDYLECGTLSAPPPPTAIWTDLAGSLIEIIGA